ncbi:hypothetical protein B0H14DRAFT_3132882 [Mycena olivaceomarginata]|nr:hypothetical protein B0H14DRAFT_3132882 [Mycena olivaceomarginata]
MLDWLEPVVVARMKIQGITITAETATYNFQDIEDGKYRVVVTNVETLMQQDGGIRAAPGYHNQKSQPNVPPYFLMMWKHINSPTLIFLRALYSLCASSALTSIHCFNVVKSLSFGKYNSTQSDKSLVYLDHTPVMRLRGGSSSDDEDDDCDSDSPGPSNHKCKRNLTVNHSRSRKSAVKATDRISNTTEPGIQITLGNPSAQNPNKTGIYVDRVVNLDSAPEVWEVLDERVAYILDVSDTPGCLEFQHKVQTINAMVKKQRQDSLSGPTGSKTKSLAQVIILEDKDDWPMIMDCRRSNLSCGGFYTCSLADEDYLDSFERCGTDSQDFFFGTDSHSQMAEAGSLIAIATEFYHSVCSKYCRGTSEDSDFPCGGHAIMRKYSEGSVNGKSYFIGCSNWSKNDSVIHRFTKTALCSRIDSAKNILQRRN